MIHFTKPSLLIIACNNSYNHSSSNLEQRKFFDFPIIENIRVIVDFDGDHVVALKN